MKKRTLYLIGSLIFLVHVPLYSVIKIINLSWFQLGVEYDIYRGIINSTWTRDKVLAPGGILLGSDVNDQAFMTDNIKQVRYGPRDSNLVGGGLGGGQADFNSMIGDRWVYIFNTIDKDYNLGWGTSISPEGM